MKTILFVDDDQYMRAKVASVFELYREEFTLVLAAHGVEAVQVLEERPVDLPGALRCVANPLSAQMLFSEVRAFLESCATGPRTGLTLFSLLQLLSRERYEAAPGGGWLHEKSPWTALT